MSIHEKIGPPAACQGPDPSLQSEKGVRPLLHDGFARLVGLQVHGQKLRLLRTQLLLDHLDVHRVAHHISSRDEGPSRRFDS